MYVAVITGLNGAAKQLPAIMAVIGAETIGFDFGPLLRNDFALLGTPTVGISVYSGVDASPQSRLLNAPTIGTIQKAEGGSGIENAAVKFRFGNAVAAVTYLLVISCGVSNGDICCGWSHIPSVSPT